jgi:hypothetical protein
MPWVPGEELLIKLWGTVEKLGTGLLSPAQIRREGKAKAEVRRYEMLQEAQAQLDIEDLVSRRKYLSADGSLLPGLPIDPQLLLSPPQADTARTLVHRPAETIESPPLDLRDETKDLVFRAGVARDLRALEHLVNLRNVVRMAEEEVETEAPSSAVNGSDPAAEPESKGEHISNEWLENWREGAEKTSDEDIRRLWARVLAGEIKERGAFPLRVLTFLRTLDHSDAQLIARAAPYVIDRKRIAHLPGILDAADLPLGKLLELNDMGVLGEHQGLNWQVQVSPGQIWPIVLHQDTALLVKNHTAAQKAFTQVSLPVTRIGEAILRLGSFETPEVYRQALIDDIKKQGFSVALASISNVQDGSLVVLQSQEV